MTDMPASRPTIRLQPGRHKRVQSGHPWAYSNEVQMDNAAKAVPPGSVVRLLSHDGIALGTAMFNPHTLIATRLLSRDPEATVDAGFLAERLARALALRDRLFDRPFYRLVHAEADLLPGLVIDRFGDTAVVQANTAGMDRLTPQLLEAIDTVLKPSTVVLGNESAARALEGLARDTRIVSGTQDGPIPVEENGAVFLADPIGGQKTGWFFDQRDNRAFVAGLAKGVRVVDFYCYNGGFAIQAALGGAASVTAVDRSAAALELTERAAGMNGVADRLNTCKTDAFDELHRLGETGQTFDIVIADPPAFVKSRKDLPTGSRAYRKMTRMAARITAPGGILLVASCSHNVDPPTFADLVARGLADARRGGRILRAAGAAPDHPVHPFLPESAYLKALVLQLD